jgi:site-specific recombinase XerD
VPKRLLSNPLAGLERLNQEVDVRHKHRALTADEVGTLVGSARASGVSLQRFDGEQRGRIYILSYMTGLRRNELASLSPRSFDLKADPPTVTVEAVASKHRRKDVLPLHPELVVMLRQWLKRLAPGQKLFPKLERNKTWFMVKKDLERVGIPYETEDGIADFHAAGRHSRITELLRNGTSLPEAKELARHSDVKMTMKYAHIGITDQAKAVAKLPAPRMADKSALHGGCISGGVGRHSPSSPGKTDCAEKSENPCGDRGFGVECRHLANGGKVEAAGIEPASCDPLMTASTCVFRRLNLAWPGLKRTRPWTSQPRQFSRRL